MKLEKLVTLGNHNADLDAEEKMAKSIRLDNTVAVVSNWKLSSSQVTEYMASSTMTYSRRPAKLNSHYDH
ncbi:hypothetical protein BHYA_0104g00270 [Botrytis hyacinthi]|uniref:Uncharacterized protein n=1 Tax=Botrytis hyacinthi TaxID=278943 RepID=A0A4Z1GP36_9HELO|nr:hypothetical protein BHYA_0104g00270 [Botrytis hyacinthi]